MLALSMAGPSDIWPTGGSLESKFACDMECAAHSIRAVHHMVFPPINIGYSEEGGRDPNERLDNQNHPEDALEGVAVSLTSATAHPKKKTG